MGRTSDVGEESSEEVRPASQADIGLLGSTGTLLTGRACGRVATRSGEALVGDRRERRIEIGLNSLAHGSG